MKITKALSIVKSINKLNNIKDAHVDDAETFKVKNRNGYEFDVKVSDYCVIKFPFACMAKSEETNTYYPVKLEGWFSSGRRLSGELIMMIKDLYEYSGSVWYGTTASEEFKKAHYGDSFFRCHPTDIKDLKSHWRKATKEEVKRHYQDYGYTVLDSITCDELDNEDIDDLIAEEYEAIADYEAALKVTSCPHAQEQLTHIMEEEKEHVRELEELKAKQEPITDAVSPMTYTKLKEKGYTHKDWEKWSDEEKVAKSQSEKEESKEKSSKKEESNEQEKNSLNEEEEKLVQKAISKAHYSVNPWQPTVAVIKTRSKQDAERLVKLLKVKGYEEPEMHSNQYDGTCVYFLPNEEMKKTLSNKKLDYIKSIPVDADESVEHLVDRYQYFADRAFEQKQLTKEDYDTFIKSMTTIAKERLNK